MMKLSRTISYAISATILLAQAKPGVPIPCSMLARAGKMPERFLLQILRILVTHGLLRSTRGVEGGYCLARPPSEITLFDIVEAFVGPLQPNVEALNALKSSARKCVLAALSMADHLSRQELQRVTLADLLHAEFTNGQPLRGTPASTPPDPLQTAATSVTEQPIGCRSASHR